MSDLTIISIGVALGSTLLYMAPLIYASMGSLFSETSGIVNISIDGVMTLGAFLATVGALTFHNPLMGLLFAIIGGAFFGLLHAFATIHLHADHTVSGIAINFIAPAIAIFLCKLLYGGSTQTPPLDLNWKMPRPFQGVFTGNDLISRFLDSVLNTYLSVYLSLVLVLVVWFIMKKTRLGLRIRACGEHPKAAETLGVNVYRVRYFCVILSGILSAVAGAAITLATVSSYRPSISAGQGYIAIAAVIFGKYRPGATVAACVLFGFCNAMVVFLGNPQFALNISPHLLSILPYVITLGALFFTGRSHAPAASGRLYSKSN